MELKVLSDLEVSLLIDMVVVRRVNGSEYFVNFTYTKHGASRVLAVETANTNSLPGYSSNDQPLAFRRCLLLPRCAI